MSGPRVALVGARRVRQGLGPFVARYLCSAGAELAGVLGTSDASAAAAARELDALRPGLRGYTDLDRLVAREAPDALAILSPHATHQPFLEAALRSRLHVLCEKPLLVGGPDLAGRAASLVDAFDRAGLLLHENCQWPYVLESYTLLCPERAAVPRHFGMELTPATDDAAGMLADALSHPLSVLQALRDDPRADVSDLRPAFAPASAGEGARLELRFRYGTPAWHIETEIRLQHRREAPRPAALALDGHWARREVREPGYALYLTDGTRSVKVPDPLGALVERFVAELRAVLSGGRPAAARRVAHRMRLFDAIATPLGVTIGSTRSAREGE